MNRKLRMGMVGGGKDAFIGAIHRLAHGKHRVGLVAAVGVALPDQHECVGRQAHVACVAGNCGR